MFQLAHILLTQFRNYSAAEFSFPKKIIGIAGPNGSGKTNLLDAIYYLGFTKSYFAANEGQLVHGGSAGFRIEGHFQHPNFGEVNATAILRELGKKEFILNHEPYTKLSAHIGKLPVVMIAPDDVVIVTGGSEERRKLMDALLCQIQPQYLQQLMAYNKLLQQRNSLLRLLAEQPGAANLMLLDVLDDQLHEKAAFVFEQRQIFMKDFLLQATAHYDTIAQQQEGLTLIYQSQLFQFDLRQLLLQNRQRDLLLQRTTAGIHKDDLKIELAGQPFKQYASQGQRKSLLFALKLTEFEMLQKYKGYAPILLLDDVFEKLDGQRMLNLLREVCVEKQGQVFITDTHADRLQNQLDAIDCNFDLIKIGTTKGV